MGASLKLIQSGLSVLALICALAGCSKEGGYSLPKEQGTSAEPQFANLRITNWGPRSTKVGKIFNAQPDGQAAFWIIVNQSLDGSDSVIAIDGAPLHSAVSGAEITASVPASLYAKKGDHTLRVIIKTGAASVQSNDVSFEVQ